MRPRKERSLPSKATPLFSLTIEDGVTPKTDRYNRDFLVKDNGSKTYKLVHPGDIVFNPSNLRWGAIARSHIKHRVVISPIYEVLEIRKNNIDPDFLEHALTCPRQIGIFATRTEGTLIERMAVKLDAFLLTEIMVPPNSKEQQEVASFLNLAKNEIDLLNNQAAVYRKQKRGLMQKLLTGEWRIKKGVPV
jgi:type I restriction enzyme, S subunit